MMDRVPIPTPQTDHYTWSQEKNNQRNQNLCPLRWASKRSVTLHLDKTEECIKTIIHLYSEILSLFFFSIADSSTKTYGLKNLLNNKLNVDNAAEITE